MKIKVTQEHINLGKRMHAACCPVSLAIKDCLNAEKVLVGLEGVDVIYKLPNFDSYNLPKSVRNFILEFDKGSSVEPIEFELLK